MNYRIEPLTAEQVRDLHSQFVHIYRTAFAEPPYYRTEADALGFADTLLRQLRQPDFRSFAAVEEDSGRLVGFAYGYTGRPGQWWYDVVTRGQSREWADRYVRDSFELVELAVLPEAQGQRLGSRLHDTILAGLPNPRAMLSTMLADTVAYQLYLRRGWQTLIEPFTFPGVARPYRIMVLELPLKKTAPHSRTTMDVERPSG